CGAVGGCVLIYAHKEEALEAIELRDPADHYVLVDDKLRMLMKLPGRGRFTTVFARQGSYAHDSEAVAPFRRTHVEIAHIADLLRSDLPRIGMALRRVQSSSEATR